MDYVTVEQVFSQAIPNLFTPGMTTSTRGAMEMLKRLSAEFSPDLQFQDNSGCLMGSY